VERHPEAAPWRAANPDLVHRIAVGAPLNPGDSATFYSGGAKGYVDYPTLNEAQAA